MCVADTHVSLLPQRSSDDSLSQEEDSAPGFGKAGELQEVVERQTADLGQLKDNMAAMVSRISELEEDLDTARKDLIKSEDMNTRLQRDLREVRGLLQVTQSLSSRAPSEPRAFFSTVYGPEGGHGGEDHHPGETLPGRSAGGHLGPRPERQAGERSGQQGFPLQTGGSCSLT